MEKSNLETTESTMQNVTFEKIAKIPVDLTIEIGKASLTVEEVMALKEGDVVALNKLNTDPFDIKVNGQRVAEGEVVQYEEHFYIKVTKILDGIHHE